MVTNNYTRNKNRNIRRKQNNKRIGRRSRGSRRSRRSRSRKIRRFNKMNKKLVGGVGVEFYSSDPCAYVNFPRKHSNISDEELHNARTRWMTQCGPPPLKRWSDTEKEDYKDRMRQEAVGRGAIWRLFT